MFDSRKRAGSRGPTPAAAGDTLDTIATFFVPRDLYEAERKEISIAVRERLEKLKKERKKVAETLGISTDQETQVSRVISLYEGDSGIVMLFRTEADDEPDEEDDEEDDTGDLFEQTDAVDATSHRIEEQAANAADGAWDGNGPVRTVGDEPVGSLTAIAEQESK